MIEDLKGWVGIIGGLIGIATAIWSMLFGPVRKVEAAAAAATASLGVRIDKQAEALVRHDERLGQVEAELRHLRTRSRSTNSSSR